MKRSYTVSASARYARFAALSKGAEQLALSPKDAYNGTPTDLRFSPLLAQSQAGLPPAYIQVMELDLIHDDGVVYERLLREAGIKTKLVE